MDTILQIRAMTAPDLERLADAMGLAPDAAGLDGAWAPARDLAQAHELFLVRLPMVYPIIGLELHRYPSGHVRAIASGRTFIFSDDTGPGEPPNLALLRVACLAADYCRKKTLHTSNNGV